MGNFCIGLHPPWPPELRELQREWCISPEFWPAVVFPICGRMALVSVNTWLEGNDGVRVGVFSGCVVAVFLNCFSYKTETDILIFSCSQLAKAHFKKALLIVKCMVDDRRKRMENQV